MYAISCLILVFISWTSPPKCRLKQGKKRRNEADEREIQSLNSWDWYEYFEL